MINQGEKATFVGHFQQKVGSEWIYISDLSDYSVKVMILNERKGKKYIGSTTSGEGDFDISKSIDSSNRGTYSFSISGNLTKEMLGDCTIEVALIDTKGNVLISDDKGGFVVKDSPLGRTL